MARNDATPLAFICSMMGLVLAANLSALALLLAQPLRRASASFGPPSFTPRALAACSAAFVLAEMASRSCSAKTG
jgi:hypothetical protein